MSTTCSKCRRANPADAAFCYFDGTLLNGHGATGPVAAGRQAFAHPFVFPSGRQCRSYDELALACNDEWDEARSLLKQGYLERFLGGLGRADLAKAARDASGAPDQDRGLDDLLDKLPSDALQPPQLHVGTTEINLGTLAVGSDRRFEIHLENRGMRLLHGSITCDDSPWLSLGDGPGTIRSCSSSAAPRRSPCTWWASDCGPATSRSRAGSSWMPTAAISRSPFGSPCRCGRSPTAC